MGQDFQYVFADYLLPLLADNTEEGLVHYRDIAILIDNNISRVRVFNQSFEDGIKLAVSLLQFADQEFGDRPFQSKGMTYCADDLAVPSYWQAADKHIVAVDRPQINLLNLPCFQYPRHLGMRNHIENLFADNVFRLHTQDVKVGLIYMSDLRILVDYDVTHGGTVNDPAYYGINFFV